jgi:Fe-S cluster assembly protein SufD
MSTAEKTAFLSSIEALFAQRKRSSIQEKAWAQFLDLGLPQKKDEAFQYVPLRKLYDLSLTASLQIPSQQKIQPYVLEASKQSCLVFAEGRFCQELSQIPEGVVVCSLEEAIKTYGFFLQPRLHKTLKEDTDPLAVLNLALQEDGLFCYVPPKRALSKPLQIIHYTSGKQSYHATRIHFFCSASSEIQMISSFVGEGVQHVVYDIALEEGARFSHLETATEAGSTHLNFIRTTQKKNSVFNHLSIVTSGLLTRNRLHLSLLGEASEAVVKGLWTLKENHQCHTHVCVEHAAPQTRSLQKFKGVLKDNAQSSFEGQIYVHSIAQKTEAYQLSQNLLLGKGAVANAKPNLKIFADDVKASHGATMSDVDEESLFYLQTRGITQEKAKALLVRGFIQEMLDQIPYPSIRTDIESHAFSL